MPDKHANALLSAYNLAFQGVIWIALLLLIKGHNDNQKQINSLKQQVDSLNALVAFLANQTSVSQSLSPVTWPGDGLGDLIVSGDLTVMGCVIWEQEVGLFQNSCTVLTSLLIDCVHGIPVELDTNESSGLILAPQCACEPHWVGPLCNIHDCYGRGVFELNTGLCECRVAGYTAKSMCQDSISTATECNVDLPIPPGERACYGQCVNGTCVCTKPGQLGRRCMQCAYPEINAYHCPKRTNWGVEFIDIMDGFAVCGGGYEFTSSDIVIMRGLNCNSTTCKDFLSLRSRCCNPLGVYASFNTTNGTSITGCPGWLNWTFNRLDFGAGTIFNDQIRLRYLQILEDHTGPGCNNSKAPTMDCLRRSYSTVQNSAWPLLELDRRPMQGYVIYLNEVSLGVDLSMGIKKYVRSIWSTTNTTVYLQGTGKYPGLPYRQRSQLYYIVIYGYPDVFCLSEHDANEWTQLGLSGQYEDILVSQMYWVNLLDQPGVFLPMEGYCGMFAIDENDGTKKFKRSILSASYPGSRNNGGYWWPLDQGTVLA